MQVIWLIPKILAVYNWLEETLWECRNWLHVRLFPDLRSTDEILASVKAELEQMPAGQEIHIAHQIIENLQAQRVSAEAKKGNG